MLAVFRSLRTENWLGPSACRAAASSRMSRWPKRERRDPGRQARTLREREDGDGTLRTGAEQIALSDVRRLFKDGRLEEWPDDMVGAIASLEVLTKSVGHGE